VPMRPMPSDSAATAPSASATAAEGTDEEVTIEISVTPKSATLTIDGVPASGGYFRKRLVRGKFVHEVHAEETGFEPQTLKLAFDRDRDVEIALVKSTKPPSPAAPAHSAPHE